jgi:hypothetical protein
MVDDVSGALVLTLIDKERLVTLTRLQQGSDLVTDVDRDAQVRWMCSIATREHFGIDTLSLAVAIFDRVLSVSRVNSKYVNCVALSSLYLAIKVCEEIDAMPQIGQFITHLNVAYSTPELLRMEVAILSKLEFDVGVPTVFRFLQVMISAGGVVKIDIERELRPPLETLLSLSLETCADYAEKWLAITVGLQRLVAVDQQELIECRETISAALGLDDKENVSEKTTSSDVVRIGIGGHKKARKRHRLNSAVGQKTARVKATVDEIADALLVLYG